MLIADVGTLVISTIALWMGARWLVEAASRLASAVGISPLIVGLTVVAFGTSSPEFAVTIDAALADQANVSVGNVVGSNVFNLGVILGCVALIHPFRTTDSLVRRDALVMGVTTVLALAFLANHSITRLEGAILCLVFAVYLGGLAVTAHREASGTTSVETTTGLEVKTETETGTTVETETETGTGTRTDEMDARALERNPVVTLAEPVDWLDGLRVVVGLVLVVVGGHLLVETATGLAQDAGVSEWFIGMTVVAAGTSLPELATSIVAARTGDVAIAVGNVVGSSVFNLLGVLGVAAMVRPMTVTTDALVGLLWLLVLTVVTTALLATGRRLTRLEGIVLVGFVAVYWIVAFG